MATLSFRSESPTASDVATARRRVGEATRLLVLGEDVVDRVVLVATELVTNAVNHAGTAFELTLDLDDDGLRLEVFDADERLPAILLAEVDATSGRGIQIVSALADEWGAAVAERDDVTGKVVWARFRLRTAGEREPRRLAAPRPPSS